MLYKNARRNAERDVGTVVIKWKEMQRIEYRGQPVLTLPMVTRLHEREAKHAKNDVRNNKDRSIENEDYFVVPHAERSLHEGAECKLL
ncbi:MAG: ORF6N domain-containing protein, partial [Deltaproteobacteria bacterium]|nr:ORF6N domain-containing protein [Deltaproteobacteria bacterium]